MKIRTHLGVFCFALLGTSLAVFGGVLYVEIGLIYFELDSERTQGSENAIVGATIVASPIMVGIGYALRKITLLNDKLARIVARDRLTDVATRDFFFDRLAKNPSGYGVSLMADIDFFKSVNDAHGHQVGDLVIAHVAGILKNSVREEDIVCRFGGEEFVVFLRDVSEDAALELAERIRGRVEQTPVLAGETRISVTLSIGASLKEATDRIEAAIKQADVALYAAKSSGRNQVQMARDMEVASIS